MRVDLRDKMARAGIPCHTSIIADGEIHRFKVDGTGKSANGWYVFHASGDRVYGTFGDWKSGVSVNVGSADADIKQAIRAKKSDGDAAAHRAEERARQEWSCADEHVPLGTYLSTKQVRSYGLRNVVNGLDVLVPMYRGGEIVGLQTIKPDGTKRFTPGCRKKGASFLIGKIPMTVCILAEGYSTAASIHAATGMSVMVAFDCGNLLPAATDGAMRCVKLKWIVAADNDRHTVGNPGLTKATEAAKELGGRIAMPSGSGTDFNDMHIELGLSAVADAIYSCL